MVLFITSACTSVDEYPISGSLAKINETQILDPMAPENNEGIVNDLDGPYGEKVIAGYQKSNSTPEQGRESETADVMNKNK